MSGRRSAPHLRLAATEPLKSATRLGRDIACTRAVDDAVAFVQRALDAVRAEPGPYGETLLRLRLGVVHHLRGDYVDAETAYRRALALTGDGADSAFASVVLRRLGALSHERGDLTAAVKVHEEAAALALSSGDGCAVAASHAFLAAALAERGKQRKLAGCLRVLRDGERVGDLLTRQTLSTLRDFVRAAGMVCPSWCGDDDGPLAEIGATTNGVEQAMADDELRIAVRLRRSRLRGTVWLADRETVCKELLVGRDAKWMRPPDEAWQDLRQKKVLRRILRALVDAHGEQRALDVAALQRAGWPDESMRHDAGVNRVHVALTELRRRGMRATLLRRDDGYVIDPAIEVRTWAHEMPPG